MVFNGWAFPHKIYDILTVMRKHLCKLLQPTNEFSSPFKKSCYKYPAQKLNFCNLDLTFHIFFMLISLAVNKKILQKQY
jgi:hypothetical protein